MAYAATWWVRFPWIGGFHLTHRHEGKKIKSSTIQ